MKKSFIITHLFILLLPLALISQTELMIEPSWELIPSDGPTNQMGWLPCNIVKNNDGSYLVPLYKLGENYGKIIKFDDDGVISNEIELQFDESYFIENTILDVWNDTVNIITHLTERNKNSAVILHTYLFDDLSMSETKEVWRMDFSGKEWMNLTSDIPLIDKNGFRTFNYEYRITEESEYLFFTVFLKFDNKFNLISEKIYEAETDLNASVPMSDNLSYNADSTLYYYISYTPDNPYYHFINVFDMEFNLLEQITLESDPSYILQAFDGHWCQNPHDGHIYAFGTLSVPTIGCEFYAAKFDVEDNDVDILRLSYAPDDISHSIILEQCICFLPDGKIMGIGVYNTLLSYAYIPDAYYAYIPVFDTNMKKKSEWYYTKGTEYNQHLYLIYPTEDNGIIMLGAIRFKIDDEILWEPYIVKFPASAFDPDNIEEAHAHGLHLAVAYPNPGGDVMNIRTALRNATLSVYDIQGRIVHEQEITDDVTSIDASRWNSGTYIWKLTINNEQFTIKEVESGKWVKD